jgi:thioredoxin-like negative regulator of GroEL
MITILKFEKPPCRLEPVLDQCRAEFKLESVDLEQFPGIVKLHRVRSYPTLILQFNGLEIGRMTGRIQARAVDRLITELSESLLSSEEPEL